MNIPNVTIIMLTLFAVCFGCSDSKVATPTDSSDIRYSFHALDGSSEFGGVEVFLLKSNFTVSDNGITQHRFTDQYNGCVRIDAVFSETEAIIFSFINWSQVENNLIIDLNLSPEPDWSMLIKNDDDGKLKAVISGRTRDGERREHLLEGASPRADDGRECIDNANVT